ncbi:MAG: peptidoglycan-binding domain-containing protein, partial [Minisyncoccia bacterium]
LSAGLSTNYFGPSTAAALKKWQKKKGIEPTGATGPKTRAALKSCRNVVAQKSPLLVATLPSSSLPPQSVPPTPNSGDGTRTPAPSPSSPEITAYVWVTGAWGSCAGNVQTRTVTCATTTNIRAADAMCVTSKPAVTQSCTQSAGTVKTCSFNTLTVGHGASVVAYEAATAVFGASCKQEVRVCTDGTLSGAFTHASCVSQQGKVCSLNGKTIPHNGTVTAYEQSVVSAGKSCITEARTCINGTLSGTFAHDACVISSPISSYNIPDPIFPNLPSSGLNSTSYISNGDIYAAINLAENGAALTSINRGGFEYVVNDPPATPQYKRGGSMQGSFFFDSPLTPGTSYHSYYNDCNNPLETGSVADFTTSFKGITSPTNIYSPRQGVFQSNAQLAYYVDPNGPTDWVDPVDYSKTGTSTTCIIGKINNPRFTVQNNAALSGIFLGKTITLENIGTESHVKNIPGVIAVDMVLALDKAYTYAGLHPAFAAVPSSLATLVAYDPKTKAVATPSTPYGRNPVIAMSSDGAHAFGIYSPQIALEGEVAGGDNGYLRTYFTTGLHTMMPYIRYANMQGGYYKFKSYYVVGSVTQVKQGIDELYAVFKVLDPKVFNWSFYVSQNGLGSMSEDQARLHWVTTGINQGLQATAGFSVKKYLADTGRDSFYGTNYYAAVVDYITDTP